MNNTLMPLVSSSINFTRQVNGDNMKIYIVVEKESGTAVSNWSTGTRVWTRKHNALNHASKSWRKEACKVLEYDLSLIQPKEIVDGN
jgi:hypothetical protein